jgi:hypothetical protein
MCLLTVEKMGKLPRSFYLRTCLEVFFIAFELYLAAPFAIAVYPQRGTMKASELEEEFRNLKDENG